MENEAARKTPGFERPRYLISFSDHINGLAALGFQPKSIISKFCQAKRDRCDIIEFAELALLEAKIEAKNPSASKAKRKISLSLGTTNRGKGARFNKDSFRASFNPVWILRPSRKGDHRKSIRCTLGSSPRHNVLTTTTHSSTKLEALYC